MDNFNTKFVLRIYSCIGTIAMILSSISITVGVVKFNTECDLDFISMAIWCIISGVLPMIFFLITLPIFFCIDSNEHSDGIMHLTFISSIISIIATILLSIIGFILLIRGVCYGVEILLRAIVMIGVIFQTAGVIFAISIFIYVYICVYRNNYRLIDS